MAVAIKSNQNLLGRSSVAVQTEPEFTADTEIRRDESQHDQAAPSFSEGKISFAKGHRRVPARKDR